MRGGENGIRRSRRERPPILQPSSQHTGSGARNAQVTTALLWSPPPSLPPAWGRDTQPARSPCHPVPPQSDSRGTTKPPPPSLTTTGLAPAHCPGCLWSLPYDPTELPLLCPSSHLALRAPPAPCVLCNSWSGVSNIPVILTVFSEWKVPSNSVLG